MDNELFSNKSRGINFWAERSKFLFTSAFMGIFYVIYIITHFYGGITNTSSGWESLGFSVAATLVTPHIICIAVGALFNLVAFFGKKVWGAVTTLVLYSVGGCLFLLYIPLCIPLIVFSAIGVYTQKKLNEKSAEEMLNLNVKKELVKITCAFIVVGISGIVYIGAMTTNKTNNSGEVPLNSDVVATPSENSVGELSDSTSQKVEEAYREKEDDKNTSSSQDNSDKEDKKSEDKKSSEKEATVKSNKKVEKSSKIFKLPSGIYTCGENINAGTYNMKAIKGMGDFQFTKSDKGFPDVFQLFGKDYGSEQYNGLKINKGDVLKISGSVIIEMTLVN